MKTLLIDNYDSFTYNLYHYLQSLNCNVDVIRNDKITTQEITVRLSMNFVATGGTLSITDEDNDVITSGGQINFSA